MSSPGGTDGTEDETVSALRAQLAEAEATVRALVDERADAVLRESRRDARMLSGAQRTLREREAELRAIFDGALDAMIIADDEGRYVDANPAACALLGTPLDAIVGKSPEAFSALPLDLGEAWPTFLEAGSMDGEFVVARPDGTRRVAEFRAKAHIAPGRHLSVLRDVTDRQREDERLRAIVQAAPVSIFALDAKGVVTLAEGRGLGALGVESGDLIGRSARDFSVALHVDGEDLTVDTVLTRVLGGRTLEASLTTAHGVFDVRLAPKRDLTGDVIGALAVATDVTRVRRIEQELSRTARTLEAVIEAATAAIITIDAEGRVQLWNPAAERIFGHRRDDVLGRRVPFLDAQKHERVVRGGESLTEVAQRAHADGHMVDVSMSVAPVRDADGAVVGAVCVLVDISEQRRLEAQLRHAQKMEGIGRLAGGIAHDFNNVLAAILIVAHGVVESLGEADPVRDEMQEIIDAASRATQLTRQLLAFGRKQMLTPTPVDLDQVVRSTSTMLRRLIPESIELRLERSPRSLVVMLDASQFEQVLLNLAVNARDAMPDGGTLTISTEAIDLDPGEAEARELAPGRYARLRVSDTGIGMDAATAAQIFEPFFTTKPVGRGTGLGLSTVYGIVRQSGGHVEVESAPARGTTFLLTLPRLDEDGVSQAESEQPPMRDEAGHGTVLVVEDEDVIRSAITRLLRRAGYQVLEAANAGEALLLAEDRDEPIHLLLTDVVMPRVSGAKLARRLSQLHPEMRILFMTGHPRDELPGTNGHPVLHKPFSPPKLLDAVRAALEAG